MSLVLNMIVRNEASILPQCLESVAPYVDSWAILDTGSTDGTQQMIGDFFAARGIPGRLDEAPFIDFAQARNAALALVPPTCDYLLLLDADMELHVTEPDFRAALSLDCYTVRQVQSGLSYWNRRIVRRGVATYVGVTHEYLDIGDASEAQLAGLWIADHGTGSNRPEKFARDLRLLRQALAEEPHNARHRFYLAETLRYMGNAVEAVEHYAIRASMGGFAEEVWYATVQEARCHLHLKRFDQFTNTALRAYDLRPTRAEPLYDLAKYYRERNRPNTALLYALRARSIPWPTTDILFVEAPVYNYGIREEIAICGFYSPAADLYDLGHTLCCELATQTDVPDNVRLLAMANLEFYRERARPRGEPRP
jgi:glycosyltransferase involved in cell wall biosynthesis